MAEWARTHTEKRPLTVVFVSELGGPSQLIADLAIATTIRWQTQDVDSQVFVPLPGWYLMSSEQLTHEQNLYFRNAKPESWPFADTALYLVH
jgi:hypothetical protein